MLKKSPADPKKTLKETSYSDAVGLTSAASSHVSS